MAALLLLPKGGKGEQLCIVFFLWPTVAYEGPVPTCASLLYTAVALHVQVQEEGLHQVLQEVAGRRRQEAAGEGLCIHEEVLIRVLAHTQVCVLNLLILLSPLVCM